MQMTAEAFTKHGSLETQCKLGVPGAAANSAGLTSPRCRLTTSESAQERRALRERERAIREAEEARRKRVTVTVDLLGRQVRAHAPWSGRCTGSAGTEAHWCIWYGSAPSHYWYGSVTGHLGW